MDLEQLGLLPEKIQEFLYAVCGQHYVLIIDFLAVEVTTERRGCNRTTSLPRTEGTNRLLYRLKRRFRSGRRLWVSRKS